MLGRTPRATTTTTTTTMTTTTMMRDRMTRRAVGPVGGVEDDDEREKGFEKTRLVRVFAVSDVHVDHDVNAAWVRGLSSTSGRQGKDCGVLRCCVVAGDVSEDLETLTRTLADFQRGFDEVFYTFGNHELWLNAGDEGKGDSKEKIQRIFDACEEIGVRTKPTKVGDDVWIVPVHAYHHREFDTEPDVEEPIPPVEQIMNDFRFSKWRDMDDGTDQVARYCDSLNDDGWDEFLAEVKLDDRVVSFSHFVPRIELLPEKRMLFYPNLPKASGSNFLRARVDALKARVDDGNMTHVFGHTHFGWNTEIDGVRYIQAALATPREWSKRPRSLEIGNFNSNTSTEPLCVYDDGSFPEDQAMWSAYYAKHERTPDYVELAPHAREFVHRRWGAGRHRGRNRERDEETASLPGVTGKIA